MPAACRARSSTPTSATGAASSPPCTSTTSSSSTASSGRALDDRLPDEVRLRRIIRRYLLFARDNEAAWNVMAAAGALQHPAIQAARRERIERIAGAWGGLSERPARRPRRRRAARGRRPGLGRLPRLRARASHRRALRGALGGPHRPPQPRPRRRLSRQIPAGRGLEASARRGSESPVIVHLPAAASRPNRYSSSSTGSPVSTTSGPVPADHGARRRAAAAAPWRRATLRSISAAPGGRTAPQGVLQVGAVGRAAPRPLARRTSSWCTTYSLEVDQRAQPRDGERARTAGRCARDRPAAGSPAALACSIRLLGVLCEAAPEQDPGRGPRGRAHGRRGGRPGRRWSSPRRGWERRDRAPRGGRTARGARGRRGVQARAVA